ncbi:hypothetical protein BZA05DRAFT_407259 [Tricharina praecox]|uniref:uncharacterized protein n=1 Tax=Tricharina praecox TaxID=43433 RepID=UPI002220EE5F|nr:uncharacterized protein BZA05DRAFT_413846 [Tricharina praecox]XP_051334569.1 uncharacterized protein BZA05DRAFT_413673 [Tricharina praecox]XP_051336530.1 uncharacterized protein BZA05DRAFT_407259 [Tricharina praecox]KAI5840881.1 hypothetical protein BZA05DRAFT_413846 [Tricharina praecox]KAI5840916.1 hypothetical protein BZA05DRAFT_413673 [Tricharina praecox]KAI5845896.1 hypothetical protein BZA05DRAFT_407259 [Tricharina praecox]
MSPPAIPSREEIHQWLLDFHSTSAALDAENYVDKFFTPTATIHFGNLPPVSGRENILAMFTQTFAALDSMEHEVVHFDIVPGTGRVYQAADITYVVKGDPKREVFTVRGLAVCDWPEEAEGEGGVMRAQRMQIFLDPSAVFARMGEVAAARAGAGV